ncbi:MAG: hypothetical protein LHV69_08820 [Elusimicrobia bacterium]|nr:hypothetical protein [Candidatus Obscuribacterium magneticum]
MISRIHFNPSIPSRTPTRWTRNIFAIVVLLLGIAANGFSEGETKNKWVEEWPKDYKHKPVVRLYSNGRILKELVGHEPDKRTRVPIAEIKNKRLREFAAKEGLKAYCTEKTGTELNPVLDGDLLLVAKTYVRFPPLPEATKPDHHRVLSSWSEIDPESVWSTLTVIDAEGKTLWTKTLKPVTGVDGRIEDGKRIISARQEDPNQWLDFDLEGNLIGVRPAKDNE